MGKYLIADLVWEFNIPESCNLENFHCFKTDDEKEAIHTINFEFVDYIEKLKETNCEEHGLKMFCQDDVKLFDIEEEDEDEVVVRGKYLENTSTFQILKTSDELKELVNILSFMRLSEVAAKRGVIALLTKAVTMGDQALIVINNNAESFVKMWLDEVENSKLIGNERLFVRVDKNNVMIYNNPWCQSNDIKESMILPINTILLVAKGKKDDFIERTDRERILSLAMFLGIMTDNLNSESLMQFCLDVIDRVNIIEYRGRLENVNRIFNKIYFS